MGAKLIVSELAIRKRYVTREAYHIMRELIEKHGWLHMEVDQLLPQPGSIVDRIRRRCDGTPDVVLFWEPFYSMSLAFWPIYRMNSHVVLFCEDLHWFDERTCRLKRLSLSVADTILASYAPVFERFHPDAARHKRLVWAPHAASPEFMLPLNGQAENVVLLSGKVNRHYPLRQQLQSLAPELHPAVVHHAHPGYHRSHDHRNSVEVGAGYARRINGCRAAFTDASKYRYLLSKYLEIPAAGALLLGDESVEDDLAALGFRGWEHYVPVSAGTLRARLDHILDRGNHEALDEIRRRGQELVWQHHKTTDRADLINQVCTAS